jgi:hypothetical protein
VLAVKREIATHLVDTAVERATVFDLVGLCVPPQDMHEATSLASYDHHIGHFLCSEEMYSNGLRFAADPLLIGLMSYVQEFTTPSHLD